MIEKKVVIIGAGISGLKAASVLHEKGCDSCIVIEARDRIGGRLHTVSGYKGRKYDVGASWHHDTLVNGLFLEEMGLPREERTPFVFDDDSMLVFDKARGRVDYDSQMELEILVEELSKYTQLQYFEDLEVEDVNYFQTIMKYLYERRELLTDDQIQYLPQLARFMELWHGIDWKSQSSKGLEIAHQGRNAFVLNFGNIAQRVASTIPQEWFELETEVREVKKEGEKVLVSTSKGETISCDYVIVTIPQSILAHSLQPEPRKGRIEFIPPLSSEIKTSLEHAHFGGLGKVVFEFESCCWSKERSRALALGKPIVDLTSKIREAVDLSQLVEKLDLDSKYTYKNGESWDFPLLFVNLAKHTDIPSFIMLMPNPLTEYIESIKDKEKLYEFFKPILDQLLVTFGCFEPIIKDFDDEIVSEDEKKPVLKNILTTSWTGDDYALGAYSACYPGDDPMNVVLALSNNQTSRIRFAGEHTIMDGAGCVYGAWESGKREALFIEDKLNGF